MLFCLDFLCLLFLPFLDKYTIAHSNFSVISCHAPWMMLANIGIDTTLGAIPLGIALAAGGARVNSATGQLDMSAASAGSA